MAYNLTIAPVSSDNGAAQGPTSSSVYINENIKTGTVIGKILGLKSTQGTFQFEFTNDLGGRYEIVGDKTSGYFLKAKTGGAALFDYEDVKFEGVHRGIAFKVYDTSKPPGAAPVHEGFFDVRLNNIDPEILPPISLRIEAVTTHGGAQYSESEVGIDENVETDTLVGKITGWENDVAGPVNFVIHEEGGVKQDAGGRYKIVRMIENGVECYYLAVAKGGPETFNFEDDDYGNVHWQVGVDVYDGSGQKRGWGNFDIQLNDIVDEPPMLTVETGTEQTNATDTGAAVHPFAGVTLRDEEGDTLTLTVSFAEADGVLGNTGGATGILSGGIRTFTFTGTVAELEELLDGLSFNPTDSAANSGTVTTSFTLTLKDPGHDADTYADATRVVTRITNKLPISLHIEAVTTHGGVQLSESEVGIDENVETDTLVGKIIGWENDVAGPVNFVIHEEGGVKQDAEGRYKIVQVIEDGVECYYLAVAKGGPGTINYEDKDTGGVHGPIWIDMFDGVGTWRGWGNYYVLLNDIADEPPALTVEVGTEETSATDTGAAVHPFAGVTLHNEEGGALTLTVSFAEADGVLENTGGDTGVLSGGIRTFTFIGTVAELEALLDGLSFNPTDSAANSGTVTTSFTLTLKGGSHDAITYADAVRVITAIQDKTPPNTAPTLTVEAGTEETSATDTGAAVHPFAGVTLRDGDGDTLTLTVSFADADGVLGNTGGVAGVLSDGIQTFTFTGTVAELEDLLDGLSFNPTDSVANSGTVTTSFTLTLKDPGHDAIAYADAVRVVTTIQDKTPNAAPTLSIQAGTDMTNATDTGAAVHPFAGVTLRDEEGDTLTLTVSFADAEGTLGNTGGVTGILSGGIRTFTFTGTVAELEALLDGLSFNPTDSVANSGTVTTSFALTLKDPRHDAATYADAVRVVTAIQDKTPLNTAPTIAVAAGTEATQAVDNGPSVTPFTGVSFSDADDDVLTVTIAFAAVDGVLENTGGVAGVVVAGTRSYTFTGRADALAILLDNIRFNPADRAANTGTFTTEFVISAKDALHDAVTNTQVKVVTMIADKNPPNTAPTISVASGSEVTQATDTGGAVNPFTGVSFTDRQDDVLTVTIAFAATDGVLENTGGVAGVVVAGTRSYTFTGKAEALAVTLDNIRFNPTDSAANSGTVTTDFVISVKDATHAPVTNTQVRVVTTIVDKTALNTAPTIAIGAGMETAQAVDNGSSVTPFTGVSFSDADDDVLTVTIAFAAVDGVLENTGGVAGVVVAGTRSYTFTGRADALAVALDNIRFNPTDSTANSGTVTTDFVISVKDATHAPVTNTQVRVVTTIVDKTPPNTAPTITVAAGTETTQATDTGGAVNPFTGVGFGDGEDDILTVTIAFVAAAGELENTGGIAGVVVAGTRSYTFTGRADALAVTLDNIRFNPTDSTANSGTVTTDFVISVKDATHAPVTNTQVRVVTTILDKTPPNTAPTIMVDADRETISTTDIGEPVKPFAGVNLSDNENDTLTLTISFADALGTLENTGESIDAIVAGTRTFTFTGKAAELEALLEEVRFNPSDSLANSGTVVTDFVIRVKDPRHDATINTQVKVVTAIQDKTPPNTAPTLTVAAGTETVHAIDNGAVVAPFTGVSFVDVDDDVLALTVRFADADGVLENTGAGTSAVSDGIRTWTFTGRTDALAILLDNVRFNPTDRTTNGEAVTTNFTLSVKDESHEAVTYTDAIRVITSFGDPAQNGTPILGNAGNGQSPVIKTTADDAPDATMVRPFEHVTILDDSLIVTATVILDDDTRGSFSLGSLNGFAYNAEARAYAMTGTVQAVQAALQGLRFDPTDRPNAEVGTQETTVFTLRVADIEGSEVSSSFIKVASLTSNRAPNDILLSGGSAQELSNSVVGDLSAVDSNAGETFTYTLVNPDGRFKIVGNQLLVNDGFKFDYEQARAHNVTVKVTDQDKLSYTKTFTIGVTDLAVEKTRGGLGHDIIKSGKYNDVLYGNYGNDQLYGGHGKDTLKGDAGNDKIWGGYGNDVLYGGAGYDVFVFDASLNRANIDRVMDFRYTDDTVWIDNRIFSKLGKGTLTKPLKLNAAYFAYDVAKDANDFVIYNKATGKLSIDLDGSGARAAIDIALFKAGTTLLASDIFII